MKRIAVALFILLEFCSLGQDISRLEVESTNDLFAVELIKEWTRGATTNGVTVSVCTGMMVVKDKAGWEWNIPMARTLEFDSDGRLVKASNVNMIGGSFEAFNYQSVESVRKTFFPTEEDRKAREEIAERLRTRTKAIEEELMAQREAREAKATRQERSRRTLAQPTPPRQSVKPCDDGR